MAKRQYNKAVTLKLCFATVFNKSKPSIYVRQVTSTHSVMPVSLNTGMCSFERSIQLSSINRAENTLPFSKAIIYISHEVTITDLISKDSGANEATESTPCF